MKHCTRRPLEWIVDRIKRMRDRDKYVVEYVMLTILGRLCLLLALSFASPENVTLNEATAPTWTILRGMEALSSRVLRTPAPVIIAITHPTDFRIHSRAWSTRGPCFLSTLQAHYTVSLIGNIRNFPCLEGVACLLKYAAINKYLLFKLFV
jgi:hypothetical protein